jgi:hypothetical protein
VNDLLQGLFQTNECGRLGRRPQRATIRLGKHAFCAQIEQPIDPACAVTSEVMACNMPLDDASEGIDAFLGKLAAVWPVR